MPNPRREVARRSILALPASNPRFLEKAANLPADGLLIDLEDAVAPNARQGARELAAKALRSYDYGSRTVSVRVNGWASGLLLADLGAIVTAGSERLDTITLPKTASATEVGALDLVLRDLELAAGLDIGGIGIDALIESAEGLSNVEAICAASPRVWSVALGPADLAASLGMPGLVGGAASPDYPGDHFHAIFLKVLLAARTTGIFVFDGPYLGLEDLPGLVTLARKSAALGYDGKWAIHPDQIETINAVFSPSAAEIARAESIISQLDDAASGRDTGALRDGEEMLDEASRKLALSILSRAARGGGA